MEVQTLSGRHVLFALLAFFGVIFAANSAFVYLAVSSFPGEHEEKSYLQGLHYNERLDRRAEQNALGWSASIVRAELQDDVLIIEMVFTDGDGRALSDLEIKGTLSRSVDDESDTSLTFAPLGNGRYRAEAVNASFGLWRFFALARSKSESVFELDTKIVVQ